MTNKHYCYIPLLLLLMNLNIAHASLVDDSNTIFAWAEREYPEFLSPAGQHTQQWDVWFYRFYPDTGIYVGVNNQSQVYVLGGVLGDIPINVGKVSDFLAIIDPRSGYIINPGNGNCVATKLTPVGMVMTYEPLPTQPIDLSVDISTIPENLLNQLNAGQQALLLEQLAEVNANLEANQLDQIENPTWRRTETVLESTFTRYKTETKNISESQAGGNTIKGSLHQVDTSYFEIINGISYLIKTGVASESILNVEPKKSNSDLVLTYAPHFFGGPAYESCEEQSWYAAVVTTKKTGTQTIDGVTSIVDESFDNGGVTVVVEAINESLTVPAGTFNTVRIRGTSDYNDPLAYYSIHWVSIENSVEVKAENYTNGKLTGGTQLISLTQ